MQRNVVAYGFVLVLLSTFVGFQVAADSINCPAVITETPAVSGIDKQWTVSAKQGDRPSDSAGVYLGAPSELGAQVPDFSKKSKKTKADHWRLPHGNTQMFWIGCSYLGTTAMLYQKVDEHANECIVSYDLLPTGKIQRLKAVDCK